MKKTICIAIAMAAATMIWYGCKKENGTEDSAKTGNIHGSVVANGEPVNGAAILLTPGGGTKITGSDGFYNFADLQPGRYELKVYKEGYQSFNKSIDLSAGKSEELVITLSASSGKLTINKSYIDMGSNDGNNVAGFSIQNSGDSELAWTITNAAGWITAIDPTSGTVGANSSTAVVFTIDRSKLSANTEDNHATLIVRSTTDGSVAELLVTVFGKGDGTNTTIGDNKDYIIVGDLYVMTKDLGGTMDWASANNSCENSTVGGFDDWRLPTIGELGLLYSKKDAIGNFTDNVSLGSAYWSSDAYNVSYHYFITFLDGQQGRASGSSWYMGSDNGYSFNGARCRAVRKASPLPAVTTLAATNISANTATLNGKIDKKGDPAFTERGFVYSNTFQNPTVDDDPSVTTKRTVSGTSTDFSTNVAGLTAEIAYYVRAYATNNNGTVYGVSVSFKPTAVVDYIVLEKDNIMVQKNDISSGDYWDTAKSKCQSSTIGGFSSGWRLPTIVELESLYAQKNTVGNFSTGYYTSSTSSGGNDHYYLNFYNGTRVDGYNISPLNTGRCRCVRTLP